jgi:hypothetical protein
MLTEIIDTSYELFAKYIPTRSLDICTQPCCMDVKDEERLASLPVRQIPELLLAEYNNGARTEKTPIDELKHFLPRYLDLISQFQFPTHSVELSFSRLTPFDITEWSKDELNLLKEFSKTYFRYYLSVYPIPSFNVRIEDILIMFSGNKRSLKELFDIHELLEIWIAEQTEVSLLHLRDLYFYGFEQYNKTKLSNPFSDKELALILRTWLNSEIVQQSFSTIIEQIIVEENGLAEKDISELNLLYEIINMK